MVTEINKVAELNENAELTLFKRKAHNLENINNIIVHNIRGVASNIKMLVEVLLRTYVNKDDRACALARTFSLEQGLSCIGESSSSLINALNNLVQGIDTDEQNIEYDNCDFTDIISDIAVQLNGFILEKNANIQLNLEVAEVKYHRCYLESMLYNFISNSLKYSRPNLPAEITIATWEDEGRTILSVKDNGLGIDLDKYGGKIFSLGQVFHEGYDSKGMGLYITRKQIESLGGNITVKSEPNKGTEFIVTL